MQTETLLPIALQLRSRDAGRRVAALLVAAFGLSMAYTALTTLIGTAPSDFDATTPTVWVGYVVGGLAVALALRDSPWSRRLVIGILAGYLAAAFLVYPHFFTPAHQDTLGWFENDAYTALLAIALYEQLRRPRPS